MTNKAVVVSIAWSQRSGASNSMGNQDTYRDDMSNEEFEYCKSFMVKYQLWPGFEFSYLVKKMGGVLVFDSNANFATLKSRGNTPIFTLRSLDTPIDRMYGVALAFIWYLRTENAPYLRESWSADEFSLSYDKSKNIFNSDVMRDARTLVAWPRHVARALEENSFSGSTEAAFFLARRFHITTSHARQLVRDAF